ncbi:MAG: invasion associated locus B family protein [Erythrobacter sp.]|uniref:invasion associated locus B family protein n=1 Tax=Erythrobacter sp. TaxID=1042 RepID=UPI00261878CE|nr:invasion associated locus B family protein [Erythrobacter sp.]MDJ0978031.1 invasion associated locus B family protein [Erythrobacter sp.]
MNRWLGLVALLAAVPLSAKDSLGVYSSWAAFRDAETPRCYAIAQSEQRKDSDPQGYASVGTWPSREVRGQFYMRLSRGVSGSARVRLAIGRQRFTLSASGTDAWAADKAMDAAIVAAMRSAPSMSVYARSRNGRRFADRYSLEGVATAMDAALLGCAQL